MADPTTAGGGTEGLREALCALMWAQQHPHERLIWAEVVKIASQHPRNMGAMRVGAMRHRAEALIAGPLADFLARASAERARVEAENARLRAQNADLRAQVEAVPHADRVKAFYDRMFARHEARPRVTSLTAERDRLKAAIQAFLDGNYDHPRRYRPGKCPHGTYYFDECPSCDEAHFTAALKLQEAPDAP